MHGAKFEHDVNCERYFNFMELEKLHSFQVVSLKYFFDKHYRINK